MTDYLRPLPGRGARAFAWIAAALLSFASPAAMAGPGHAGDEGHSHDGPQSASAQSPRVVATSDQFQLVGILKADKLKIFLDREPDNVPVTKAAVTVVVGAQSTVATPITDGTFEMPGEEFAKPGDYELQFTIVVDGRTDLLAGVLTIASPPNAVAASAKTPGQFVHVWERARRVPIWLAGLVIFGVGLGTGSLLSRHRRLATAAGLVAGLLATASLLDPAPAVAGPGHSGDEGHAHGPEQSAGLSDQASRLADGSVFLPKPTQRLLEVRTRLVELGEAHRVVTVPGKVVAGTSGPAIEVALYDQVGANAIRAAYATGPGDAKATLQLVAQGIELKNNALMLTLSVPASAPVGLRTIGQRMTVMLDSGEPIKGAVLPRAAVVTAPNGQAVVFEHTEPERFTPKLVLFAPIDPERVVVTSGLATGDKIVVEAASLINQVR